MKVKATSCVIIKAQSPSLPDLPSSWLSRMSFTFLDGFCIHLIKDITLLKVLSFYIEDKHEANPLVLKQGAEISSAILHTVVHRLLLWRKAEKHHRNQLKKTDKGDRWT